MDKFYGIHPWEHGHSFGGKCLPKDLNAIIALFNEGHIHDPVLLKAVRKVNEDIDLLNTSQKNEKVSPQIIGCMEDNVKKGNDSTYIRNLCKITNY